MTVDERQRHELFLACEQGLGPEQAETLMALLPPVGWADVATKQDLDHLEIRVIGEMHRLLNAQTKMLFFGVVTMLASLAATVVALR